MNGPETKKKKNSQRANLLKNKKNNNKIVNKNEDLNDEEKSLVVSSLHRVLKPFLLRRIKSDVIADLPNKVSEILYFLLLDSTVFYCILLYSTEFYYTLLCSTVFYFAYLYFTCILLIPYLYLTCIFTIFSQIERTIMCELSGLQSFLYQSYRNSALIQESTQNNNKNNVINTNNIINNNKNHNNGDFYDDNNDDGAIKIGKLNYNNVLMQLRKLCNHPYLLLEDVRTIPDELYYQYIVASSGKLAVLDGLLKELLPKGHKVS